MTELVRDSPPDATGSAPDPASPPGTLRDRAVKQAARELLLAQASDWSFILRTGTSPEYAADRVKAHLVRFTRLYDQIRSSTIDETWLASIESADNIFPDVDYRYWGSGVGCLEKS
jgi:1,4-alpha-glucan branching enzyme